MGFSSETIAKRAEKVRQGMRKRGLAALVLYYAVPRSTMLDLVSSGNVRYLTGWSTKEVPAMLVLPLDEEPVLIVRTPFAKAAIEMKKPLWIGDLRIEGNANMYGSLARQILQERGISSGRIGVSGQTEMPETTYKGLTSDSSGGSSGWEFEAADDLVFQERIIKDPEEIEMHRIASKISDSVMYSIMNGARAPGKWAWQLMAEAEHTGRSFGAEHSTIWLDTGPVLDPPGFDLWEQQREIQDGDRINAGTYIIYEGYWGHSLRMGIRGKPSPELKRYAEAIIEVQDAGIDALKPGKPLVGVNKAMKAVIDKYSPLPEEKDSMRFRPGHGLGLQYADPLVSDAFPQPGSMGISGGHGDETTLTAQPGMVMELHPNFSVPGLGSVCMGDVVLVTESGAERLTKFPRELYEI